MERRFLYSIEGFQPPSELSEPGGFGFQVFLDKELARKSFEKPLPEKTPLIEIGRDIIRGYGYKVQDYFEPYLFVRNENVLTSFIHSLDVPGSSCGLDLCEDGFGVKRLLYHEEDNWIQYSPHNIDHASQAAALLSLFTKWANTMAAVLDLEYTKPITPPQL